MACPHRTVRVPRSLNYGRPLQSVCPSWTDTIYFKNCGDHGRGTEGYQNVDKEESSSSDMIMEDVLKELALEVLQKSQSIS